MKITILSLFPDFFTGPLQSSMLKRAQSVGAVEIKIINIRDFAQDKHHTTDDRPFGGGPGMVMKVEPIALALAAAGIEPDRQPDQRKVLLTSAKGKRLHQHDFVQLAQEQELIIICGHYEGVDERIADHYVDTEVRIGDYVLTGGEPAALVMVDAVTRLLPGVLGNEESTSGESHEEPGVLGYPQYTRPEELHGWKVPDVLLGGHHAEIEQWREAQRKREK